MKKTLLALMLGGLIAGEASAVELDFSYVSKVDGSFGTAKKEAYDVAAFLPGEVFSGYTLKAISASLNDQKGPESFMNCSVWVSSQLALDGSVNKPDASYDVTPGEDCVMKSDVADYTITDAGVYVGFSFDIDLLNAASRQPVLTGSVNEANAFFIHSSRTYKSWTNITDAGAPAITVTLEAENLPALSVSIVDLADPVLMKVGEAGEVPVVLSSTSTGTINSVDIEYTVNGATTSNTCTLESPLAPGIYSKFGVVINVPAFKEPFRGEMDFKVVKVNGEANEATVPGKATRINVRESFPSKQTLMEEYTGTWCGWCTRGYAALEYIKKNYPEFVVAAFHNDDAMAITSAYPSYVTGFPHAYLDRVVSCDPYYGTETYNSILPIVDDILAMNKEFTPWEISISHTWETDDLLTANVDVTNITGFKDGQYRIVYLLVADGLSGESSQWNQSNYYNTYAQSANQIDELNDFCKGGKYGASKVAGLVFDDVVISTTGIRGVEGSIPSSLDMEETASHSLTFDLTTVKEGLIASKNKLRIVAAVADADGRILNSAKNEVNDYTGAAVDVISGENAPVEYYNLQGVKVENPSQGIFIRKQGDKTTKVAIK